MKRKIISREVINPEATVFAIIKMVKYGGDFKETYRLMQGENVPLFHIIHLLDSKPQCLEGGHLQPSM
jgi:hypothetical protein